MFSSTLKKKRPDFEKITNCLFSIQVLVFQCHLNELTYLYLSEEHKIACIGPTKLELYDRLNRQSDFTLQFSNMQSLLIIIDHFPFAIVYG